MSTAHCSSAEASGAVRTLTGLDHRHGGLGDDGLDEPCAPPRDEDVDGQLGAHERLRLAAVVVDGLHQLARRSDGAIAPCSSSTGTQFRVLGGGPM